MMNIKPFLFLVLILLFGTCASEERTEDPLIVGEDVSVEVAEPVEELEFTSDERMQELYDTYAEEEQVLIKAEVIKLLPDDNKGSRHQKFIVELNSGQTVLISHNIDLAPRIADLEEGDEVKIFGQYEWNDRGGVIHWTHHDPDGEHVGGWIEHNGKTYE